MFEHVQKFRHDDTYLKSYNKYVHCLSYLYAFFAGNMAIYRTAINFDSSIRYRQRFFDQAGHEAMCASSGNKHFFH